MPQHVRKPRRKQPLPASEAIARIDKMMPLLHRNIASAIRIEAVLVAGNELTGRMQTRSFIGASAYNTIARSLAYDLAIHLARLYDVSRMKQPASRQDVASIPFLVRLLRQKRCQKALSRRARHWYPNEHGHADKCEQDCLRALERALTAYSSTFLGPDGRSGLRAVKAFRDDFLAHSLIKDFSGECVLSTALSSHRCRAGLCGGSVDGGKWKQPEFLPPRRDC